jgi:hypothetical protein
MRHLAMAGGILAMVVTASGSGAQTKLPPETRNAALRYWLAFADLHDPPSDKTTQELLEKTAAGESSWDEATLGSILDQNLRAIQEMQRATRLPDCDWGLEYSRGSRASIAYVPRARVLARLNTLYGMRMMAQGQTETAVETWLEGIRFSQHLARGGTLIFKLVARMSLLSNFQALTSAAQSGGVEKAQTIKIAKLVGGLPADGFNWSEALGLEEVSLELTVRDMRQAANPGAYYQEVMGAPAPSNFAVPNQKDLAELRSLITQAQAALRLPPQQAREHLQEVQRQVKQLNTFLQQTVPPLVKINDARAEVEASRAKLLRVLAGS